MAENLSNSIFNTAGTIGSIANTYYGAQTQSSLLRMQANQESMAAAQRMGKRVDDVNQVVGAQRASAAARGIDLASTSVQAMSKSSYDAFNTDKATEDINQRLRDAQLRTSLAMVRNRQYAGYFKTFSHFNNLESKNADDGFSKIGSAVMFA